MVVIFRDLTNYFYMALNMWELLLRTFGFTVFLFVYLLSKRLSGLLLLSLFLVGSIDGALPKPSTHLFLNSLSFSTCSSNMVSDFQSFPSDIFHYCISLSGSFVYHQLVDISTTLLPLNINFQYLCVESSSSNHTLSTHCI